MDLQSGTTWKLQKPSVERSWTSCSAVEALPICPPPRNQDLISGQSHAMSLSHKTLNTSARCNVFLLDMDWRPLTSDIKERLLLKCWPFKKKKLKPKWAFCPSFGIHQSQTRGMWWHPKSLWLIHAGPQAFAPQCHMVKQLLPPGFAPQPDSTSKNSSHHLNGDRLEHMQLLTVLFDANPFYPFPHWDSLA